MATAFQSGAFQKDTGFQIDAILVGPIHTVIGSGRVPHRPLPQIPPEIVGVASTGQGNQQTRALFGLGVSSRAVSVSDGASVDGDGWLSVDVVERSSQVQVTQVYAQQKMMSVGRSGQMNDAPFAKTVASIIAVAKSGGECPATPTYSGEPMPGSYFDIDSLNDSVEELV